MRKQQPRVQVAADTPDKTHILKLGATLPAAPAQTLGHWLRVVLAADALAPDGDISDVEDTQLAQWGGWSGDPAHFARRFRETCCDSLGRLLEHSFHSEPRRRLSAGRRRTAERRGTQTARASQPHIPAWLCAHSTEAVRTQTSGRANKDTRNNTSSSTTAIQEDLTLPSYEEGVSDASTSHVRTGMLVVRREEAPINSRTRRRRPDGNVACVRADGTRRDGSWLRPYQDAWTAAYDGHMAIGKNASALSVLEDLHGPGETLRRWGHMLSTSKAEYANAEKLLQGWGAYSGDPLASLSPRNRAAHLLAAFLQTTGLLSQPGVLARVDDLERRGVINDKHRLLSIIRAIDIAYVREARASDTMVRHLIERAGALLDGPPLVSPRTGEDHPHHFVDPA
jgi:hypothetical protein